MPSLHHKPRKISENPQEKHQKESKKKQQSEPTVDKGARPKHGGFNHGTKKWACCDKKKHQPCQKNARVKPTCKMSN